MIINFQWDSGQVTGEELETFSKHYAANIPEFSWRYLRDQSWNIKYILRIPNLWTLWNTLHHSISMYLSEINPINYSQFYSWLHSWIWIPKFQSFFAYLTLLSLPQTAFHGTQQVMADIYASLRASGSQWGEGRYSQCLPAAPRCHTSFFQPKN